MMMTMMTANQCPRVSGNNAIGCEKFTDASSRNCTLAIIFVRIFIVFLAIIIIFDAIFIVSAVVIVIIIMNWGFVSLFNWRYTNTNCALNWQASYTFLYLYRVKGKHVLIGAHISPLWYIWARCTLSMIKYLVLGIWVTKLFIGLATLCTAFWLTHKSNSLGFVAEWFMLCHNRQHIWPGTIWFSKVLCLNIEAKPSPHHQPATPYNLLPDAVFPLPHQLIFTQTPFFVELPYFHSAFEFCWAYFHSDNEQWKSEAPLTRPNLIP